MFFGAQYTLLLLPTRPRSLSSSPVRAPGELRPLRTTCVEARRGQSRTMIDSEVVVFILSVISCRAMNRSRRASNPYPFECGMEYNK
jgi:hypothetical protein